MKVETLRLKPLTVKSANELVKEWHRHHKPTVGGLFAVGVTADYRLVGAAIVGRPCARAYQDGFTCEITRLVSDGTPNVCSMLYSAAWRAAKAIGYTRMITYTLISESGVSLKAAGWTQCTVIRGKTWDTPSRRRIDKSVIEDRIRWVRCA